MQVQEAHSPATGAWPPHTDASIGLDSSYCLFRPWFPKPRWGSRGGTLRHAGTCCRASVGRHWLPHPPLQLAMGTAPGPGSPYPSPGTRTWACLTPSQELKSRLCPSGLGCARRWQNPRGCSRYSHGQRISTALRKPHEDSFLPCPLPQLLKGDVTCRCAEGDMPRDQEHSHPGAGLLCQGSRGAASAPR